MARRPPIPAALVLPGEPGGRFLVFLFLSGVAILATIALPHAVLTPILFGISTGLFVAAAISGVLNLTLRIGRALRLPGARAALEALSCPAVLTDAHGRYIARNGFATHFPEVFPGQTLSPFLAAVAAEPEATVLRIVSHVGETGLAQETVGLAASQFRISARRAAHDLILWTLHNNSGAGTAAPLDRTLALLSVGHDGRILSANPAAETLLGDLPKDISELVADLPLRQGGTHELRISDRHVPATVVEFPGDGAAREICLVPQPEPVSHSSSANGPLLNKPDLLETLPVPMLKIAADGTLIEANTGARTILALDNDDLPPLFELVEGMGRPIAEWLKDAAEGRGLLKPEIVRAVIPGQELFLQITLGRAVDRGQIVLVGILNDATELKTLEAQFVQSQKMQAIGQLAGGVAHDFNNLLTAISGHCDLLLLRHDAGDPEYADLIQISQNANRAASLVGQLLAFSRKQNLKPQAIDLRDTMSDLAHLLNRLIGERIRLDVTHSPGPQMIRADRRQLEQVIVNLVVNARDAMPEGGTIVVQTRTERLTEEVVRDRARLMPGEYVVIEVRDTGIGIGHDGLSKIFEPFYTTKKTGEGTGLGLSTAYGIVKQTGGFIFVESEIGKGTEFSLYFPASANVSEEPKPAPQEAKAAHAATGDGVVLLVEDEAPVRAFAGRALRMRGYTVIEADCAEAALTILEDEALGIDIFLTDVVMPGMDGPTWVRQALKTRPDTRVVFMSGYAEEGRAEKQARIPNSVFLAKPFSLHQLTALVQEQLG